MGVDNINISLTCVLYYQLPPLSLLTNNYNSKGGSKNLL